MTTASPLGKYGEAAAAAVAVLLVVTALLIHAAIALHLVPPGAAADTAWIDASAGAAVGIILGQRATTNGAAKIAAAAHQRIDELEAAQGINTHPSS